MSKNSDNQVISELYWLVGGDADPGIDYCRDCADTTRKRYGDKCMIDGGWPRESYYPPTCYECGAPLAAIVDEGKRVLETEQQWHDYDKILA